MKTIRLTAKQAARIAEVRAMLDSVSAYDEPSLTARNHASESLRMVERAIRRQFISGRRKPFHWYMGILEVDARNLERSRRLNLNF